MNKKLIVMIVCALLSCYQGVYAAQTATYYFSTTCPQTNSVTTNGGNTSATINVDTGALSAAFTPAFMITTNSKNSQSLTLSAKANTQGGLQNSVFNISSTNYIILTNSTTLPPISSLTDIKSGTPTAANNPNAIAYQINNPAATAGKLSVTYNSTNKNWDLTLTNRGQTPTSVTVPVNTPLNGTFSTDDETGSYQAIITLSFN